MKLHVVDIKGQTIEEFNTQVFEDKKEVNNDILLQYVRIYLSNQRQGTSKVKTKGEVSGSGQKPWKQKGTGRARAGSRRSPLWVGGGITHGPTPKDWSLKMNAKMKKKAFSEAMFKAYQEGAIKVADISNDFKKISTKTAGMFLKSLNLDSKVLVVHDNNANVYKSFRNIIRVNVKSLNDLNTFDILNAKNLIIEKKAVKSIEDRLIN